MTKLSSVATLILGVTFATTASAHTPPSERNERIPTDAVFTPYSETVVTTSDFDHYDGRKSINGVPYTGVVLDLYPDGSKKTRYSLLDGKAQGIWIDWYQDGRVKYYGEWRDGKGNGPFIYFHPTGEVSERTYSNMGVWQGSSEGWNADGSKSQEIVFKDGQQTSRTDFPKRRF